MTLQKEVAAKKALEFIEENSIIGVGTGSTVDVFIELLKKIKGKIDGAVSSSLRTTQQLKALGIPVFDLNSVPDLHFYFDGADAANTHKMLIKGRGGALTQEKIIALNAKKFICMMDDTKPLDTLTAVPLPIEILPQARSYVARELVKLGGNPTLREGFVTDNHQIILDVYDLPFDAPLALDDEIKLITGVVCHGLFAKRKADILLVGKKNGICDIY